MFHRYFGSLSSGETAGPTLTMEDQVTSVGSVVGTVSYMSPEQVCAKDLDARTDLFSFGVVLYEMVTGNLPFRGESPGMIFDSILNRAPVPAVRLNPDLPAELERIIDKCLEKDRNLRYQHAAEIRADLQRLRRDTDSARVITGTRRTATAEFAERWKEIVPDVGFRAAKVKTGYDPETDCRVVSAVRRGSAMTFTSPSIPVRRARMTTVRP
jgi:serine/threonine protein kinase